MFQASICLRLEASFDGDPLDILPGGRGPAATVRRLHPHVRGAVASLSPDLFLRGTGRAVVTRPIKGTH